MTSRLGRYVAQRRQVENRTCQQIAQLAGYRNANKGARRITALEREGVASHALLRRITRVLHLDEGVVRTLQGEDSRAYHDELNRWLDEPEAPELRFRPLAAVWCRTPLPAAISKEDAILHAKDRARETGFTHVLRWSRRERAWIYPSGLVGAEIAPVEDIDGPCSIVGRQRLIFG